MYAGYGREAIREDNKIHTGEIHYSSPLLLLVTLDGEIPLTLMIQNYLRGRSLIYNTADGRLIKKIITGAGQGSILGPDHFVRWDTL